MIAWYGGNSSQQTQPIKQKLPNGWGLYDMLGNVYEWCADDRRSYGGDSASDPVGSLDSAQRALRGGSWGTMRATCALPTAARATATTGPTTSVSGAPEFGRELKRASKGRR